MAKYLVKRLFYIIFILLILSVLIFVLFRNMPGDPALTMIAGQMDQMTPEQFEMAYARARELMGLDEPILAQFFIWLGNMLTGNMGYSATRGLPVLDVVRIPMLNTVIINILNLILVFAITVPLGIVSAIKRGSTTDNSILVGSIVGLSFPVFLFGLLCILIFAIIWQIFPINGMSSPIPPTEFWPMIWDRLYFMALPLIVLVLSSLAGLIRYVRASMIEALSMDYVRTARSKGLAEKTIIYSHAFKNALIPIITVMTGWFIGIFGGSVIVERLFAWNGMGDVMLTSLSMQDFAVVMSMNMFYILISLVGLLFMDIAYAIADPRIKFE